MYVQSVVLEDKVREELSVQLRPYHDDLKQALEAVGLLDVVLAKARQAIRGQLTLPQIPEEGEMVFEGLFHPQIREILEQEGRAFQAVDLKLEKGTTVITGANMAGKTVLLKSVQLAQYLMQFGFYVPARRAGMPLVEQVLTSIGDDQDELNGLSSYAAEMLRVDEMIRQVRQRSKILVLIDELARTTNPVEGRAIVNGVVDFLTTHRVMAMVTTHYSGITAECRKLRVRGFVENRVEGNMTLKISMSLSIIHSKKTAEKKFPRRRCVLPGCWGSTVECWNGWKIICRKKILIGKRQYSRKKIYMKSKLGIDFDKVGHAREMARKIADQVQDFVDGYTTVAVERTLCRLLGIDGVDVHAVPLPNILVDELKEKNVLGEGILFFLGNVMVETGMTPQEIAEQVAAGKVDVTRVPVCTPGQREKALQPYIEASIRRISDNRKRRENYIATIGEGAKPYLYVIVATGNIYEDVVQAQAAARQGADVIAVIRTTGQSLLDYVPYGATTEGFGGTFATQENFRIMRKALDEVGEEVGRYIRLCNYCSGLCMPEIAVMGALEGLDVMLNDALYGILFRDINMQRTLVDQFMSRVINGFAGVIINTGEDNYLTTADAVEEAHTVLASDLINEQLALLAGLPEEQMGLGHAFEMDPMLENGFLYELAQAQMTREIFRRLL